MKTEPTYLALAAALGAASPALAQSQRLAPADAKGIRSDGGGPVLLPFLSIDRAAEDRTVMEFDLTAHRLVPWARLELGISNLDPAPPAGVVGVFAYDGDGTVSPGEFSAGSFVTAFAYDAGPGVAPVDVTRALDFRNFGGFLGLRLSTTTADRFRLGSVIGQPEPALVVGTCYADCDPSTGEGVLDIFDFLCFQNAYAAGLHYACGCSETGVWPCDIFDFLCFQFWFDRGCR